MKKEKTYFYMDTDESKEPFVVFAVEHKIGCIDLAERKAKTIVKMFNRNLAGGYFSGNCNPYNLNDYVIVKVPNSTKPQRPTAQDRFIDTLIDYEQWEFNRRR